MGSKQTTQIMSTSSQLSDAQLQELRYELKMICKYQIARRILTILLCKLLGLSHADIGLVLGICSKTVSRYITAYESGGLSLLIRTNYRKNKSALDRYSEAILSDLDTFPAKSINEARKRISLLVGITRSPTRIKAFMARHGLKFRKVGYVPGKADPDKQKQWLEDILTPCYEQAKAGLRHLFFMDAVHFTLGAFVCKVWSKDRKFIRS